MLLSTSPKRSGALTLFLSKNLSLYETTLLLLNLILFLSPRNLLNIPKKEPKVSLIEISSLKLHFTGFYAKPLAVSRLHGSVHDAPRFFFASAGSAFRSRAGAGLTSHWAAGPANLTYFF